MPSIPTQNSNELNTEWGGRAYYMTHIRRYSYFAVGGGVRGGLGRPPSRLICFAFVLQAQRQLLPERCTFHLPHDSEGRPKRSFRQLELGVCGLIQT